MSPDEEHREVVGEDPEPGAVRLARDLDRAYQSSLPASRDGAIRRALVGSAARGPRPVAPRAGRGPHRAGMRMVVVGAGALLALALVSAGYGMYRVVSLADEALTSSSGGSQVETQGLGQVVNLSRSRCDFSLTVHRVYADAHLVTIAYTLRGPSGREFLGGIGPAGSAPSLHTLRGRQLAVAQSGFAPGIHGSATGDYLSFRAEWLRNQPSPLRLHLNIPAVEPTERYAGRAPRAPACERDGAPVKLRGLWWRHVTIPGPFNFTLTVPIVRDLRVARLALTARLGGLTVALRRVEISPGDVTVYWRDNQRRGTPTLIAQLSGPRLAGLSSGVAPIRRGQSSFAQGTLVGTHHDIRQYVFDVPGYGYRGRWTLLVYRPGSAAPGGLPKHSSSLIFTFKVP